MTVSGLMPSRRAVARIPLPSMHILRCLSWCRVCRHCRRFRHRRFGENIRDYDTDSVVCRWMCHFWSRDHYGKRDNVRKQKLASLTPFKTKEKHTKFRKKARQQVQNTTLIGGTPKHCLRLNMVYGLTTILNPTLYTG
jgi:hypothetical protein